MMKLFSLALCGSFALASHVLAAEVVVISEDYESYGVGSGTYTGAAWSYVYTDEAMVDHGVVASRQTGSLSIGNGITTGGGFSDLAASPKGGNYLLFTSATGSWEGLEYHNGTTQQRTFQTMNAWESPTGHFYRLESLTPGQTYKVQLTRSIQLAQSAFTIYGFSVWDGSGLDLYQPYANTPSNLLTNQSYSLSPLTGGWEDVSVTFTAPSSGSVAFMMGLYAPDDSLVANEMLLAYAANAAGTYTTVPGEGQDWDGNIRTVDSAPGAGWVNGVGGNSSQSYASQTTRLALDGFTLLAVPEPSTALLVALGSLAGVLRRRRD